MQERIILVFAECDERELLCSREGYRTISYYIYLPQVSVSVVKKNLSEQMPIFHYFDHDTILLIHWF